MQSFNLSGVRASSLQGCKVKLPAEQYRATQPEWLRLQERHWQNLNLTVSGNVGKICLAQFEMGLLQQRLSTARFATRSDFWRIMSSRNEKGEIDGFNVVLNM